MGKKLGIKIVATNDVHFTREEDAEAHDRLICIFDTKKISRAEDALYASGMVQIDR